MDGMTKMRDRMTFKLPRYFRPVCVLEPRGYYGGPRFYEETTDPTAGPLIVKAALEGRLPLHVARDELDRLENQ